MTVVFILLQTSHRLQPLYLKFEGRLQAALNGDRGLYLKICVNEKIIQYELAEFFNKAIAKITKLKKKMKFTASELQTFAF
jgi:hypothetical protein